MTDTVLTYKGMPIIDLTKNELVDAMTWAFQEIEYQRERADRFLNAAALAEPEPVSLEQGVQQMHPFVVRHYTEDERPTIKGNGFDGLEIGEDREEAEAFVAWINEKLARLGNYPGLPDSSTPQPVPVSKRLPGPEDCDVKGMCWWFAPETYSQWNRWVLSRGNGTEKYWLPHNALHLPSWSDQLPLL